MYQAVPGFSAATPNVEQALFSCSTPTHSRSNKEQIMALKLQKTLLQPHIRGFVLKELVQCSWNEARCTQIKAKSAKVATSIPPIFADLPLTMAALNINSIQIPPHIEPPKARIPPPMPISKIIELPQIQTNISYEDQLPTQSIEEPSPASSQEKQAARLIVIRRKKMKKHKLKKLRKKMKFVWGKERQNRELKKEKAFQAFLLDNIKQAQMFDPAKYAAEKLLKVKEVELPQVWHGVRYPEHIIKQLMEEQENKKQQQEADEKRRASMSPFVKDYLDNLPK